MTSDELDRAAKNIATELGVNREVSSYVDVHRDYIVLKVGANEFEMASRPDDLVLTWFREVLGSVFD